MTRVRVAVVGVGHLGKVHVRLLSQHPEAELVAVVDTNARALQAMAEAHNVMGVSDYRLLEGRVDAACVVVPTNAHREVAGWLLTHGIDALVEKPIAPTVEEGLELVRLAEAHGRILQVGHVERFNPALTALRELGIEPRYIETERLAPFSFRSVDVGVVLDLMIHDLDLVLAMVKRPIQSVDAFGGAVFTPQEDLASAILKFEGGCVAHLTANRVAMKPLRKMRVFSPDCYASIDFHGARGTVIRKQPGWDLRQLDVSAVDRTQISDLWKYVFEGLLHVQEYKVDEGNPLRDELSAFLACVRTRCAPVVSGADGCAAVSAAHQVLQAIACNPW